MPTPAPSCSCGQPTEWYRTELRSVRPRAMTHFFACKACHHVAMVDAQDGAAPSEPRYASDKDTASAIWITRKIA